MLVSHVDGQRQVQQGAEATACDGAWLPAPARGPGQVVKLNCLLECVYKRATTPLGCEGNIEYRKYINSQLDIGIERIFFI